jgi:hypothetical protein
VVKLRLKRQDKAICGEMSFLEDAPASANVIADGEIEAYHH